MVTRDELSELALDGLARAWSDVRQIKTHTGWGTESAVAKSTIERLIAEILSTPPAGDTSIVECELPAKIEIAGELYEFGKLRLRPGGLELPKHIPMPEGIATHLEVRNQNNHPLRVKCTIGSLRGAQMGVRVTEAGEGGERRVQRLLVALLESQVD